MMQRDETDLLEPWLAYHGYLFGFENLYVFDNGSQDPAVLDILARFQAAGVTVDTTYSGARDYEGKGEIIADCIRRIGALGQHDLFFPLDCDEFVVAWADRRGITCRRGAILDYLAQFVGKDCVLQHSETLANVPGRLDRFYLEGVRKVYFAGGNVHRLEHGNHNGGVVSGAGLKPMGITYLHLHNKPFAKLLAHAVRKLQHRTDVTDPEAIRAYRGHGDHLVRYFTMTAQDYLESFDRRESIAFPEFRATLAALGADSGIVRLFASERAPPPATAEFDAGFDAPLYLEANPDLRAANVPGLLHFWKHGRREQRPLAPRVRQGGEPVARPAPATPPPSANPPAAGAGRREWVACQLAFGADGNAADYQRAGWSRPENGYTWTNARHALLDLPAPVMAADYVLQANVAPFVWQDRVVRQTIEIRANNVLVWSDAITGRCIITCAVPWQVLKDRPALRLEFVLPDAARPTDLGAHATDSRLLAARFASLRLFTHVPEPADATAPFPTLPAD
jgi:hypothetical protein